MFSLTFHSCSPGLWIKLKPIIPSSVINFNLKRFRPLNFLFQRNFERPLPLRMCNCWYLRLYIVRCNVLLQQLLVCVDSSYLGQLELAYGFALFMLEFVGL